VNLSLRDQGTGAQQSERRAEGGDGAGCLYLGDLPSAKAIAEGALARARARLGGRQGPTIKTTMLVESRAAITLLQYLLAPATAANIQQGRSFWPALIDTLAFSERSAPRVARQREGDPWCVHHAATRAGQRTASRCRAGAAQRRHRITSRAMRGRCDAPDDRPTGPPSEQRGHRPDQANGLRTPPHGQ